jgi:glycosyltransferase involved in cell wall biosynthesis
MVTLSNQFGIDVLRRKSIIMAAKRKKVLFMRGYFMPESAASNQMCVDFISALSQHQYEVTVLCPIPTRGVSDEIRNKYKKIKIEKLDENITIRRFSLPKEKGGALTRAFRYILQNIYQVVYALFHDYDVLYLYSTPPTNGLVGGLLRKIKKKPFIYNLQDIFPDSLVNAKLTHKGSILWKIGRKLEDYTYKNADKIIVICEGFKRNIMEKGVPEDKIDNISNWIDLESVYPIERKYNKLIAEMNIDSQKFLVVYAGNFGDIQGADIVLRVAEVLQQNNNIYFVIFGGGAHFTEAKKQAESLSNVTIHELMPLERISEVYSLGDVALITCKPGTGNAGMPSKVLSIMACNTPIIASFDVESDLADVIRNSGAGECVEPGNVELLKKAILNRYELQIKYGKSYYNLREYIRKNSSRESCVKRYIDVLENLE